MVPTMVSDSFISTILCERRQYQQVVYLELRHVKNVFGSGELEGSQPKEGAACG